MEKRALILFLLKKMRESGSWCGETHVQKCLYFLQSLFRIPTGFNYILYKHGPYSFELSDELTAMRADYCLRLEPRKPYGPSLSHGVLSEKLIQKYFQRIIEYDEAVSFIAEKLSNKTVKDLEKVATALYIKREKDWQDERDLIQQMVTLKPHISLEDASEAVKFLKELEKSVI